MSLKLISQNIETQDNFVKMKIDDFTAKEKDKSAN